MAAALALAVAAACLPRSSASASDLQVSALSGPSSVGLYEKFETSATISPQPSNPFDPAEIDVAEHLTAPSGATFVVPGFYYQGFTRSTTSTGDEALTPSGTPSWKVRFAPNEIGAWSWYWTVATPNGATSTTVQSVTVQASGSHGFLKQSPSDSRYLQFSDGAPFVAIGENLSFPEDNTRTYAYDSWFQNLAAQGANYARIWMAPFGNGREDGFGLEWTDSALGDYTARLDHAWELDYVVDRAHETNIYLQLAFLTFGSFSTSIAPDWANNPYNVANGGPLSSPSEYFTSPAAASYAQRLFRYIVARWGYSSNVAAWELFNEVNYVDGYAAAASTTWHQAMASFIRQIDVSGRLVTTSLGSTINQSGLWSSAGLNTAQIHRYQKTQLCNGCNWPVELRDTVLAYRAANPGLPALVGEEAISNEGGSQMYSRDLKAIGFHDALWAPIFAGSFGTGLSWWWKNVDTHPTLYYPLFGAIARFVAPIRLDQANLVSDITTQTPVGHTLDVYGLHGSTLALYWLKDRAYQWGSPAAVPVVSSTITLPSSTTGHWCGLWYDTWQGSTVSTVTNATGGSTLQVPTFSGDIALRVAAC